MFCNWPDYGEDRIKPKMSFDYSSDEFEGEGPISTKSFGYSSDEFNALFALAHKVRKELVGAPSQFKEISDKFVTLIINQQMLTT